MCFNEQQFVHNLTAICLFWMFQSEYYAYIACGREGNFTDMLNTWMSDPNKLKSTGTENVWRLFTNVLKVNIKFR